MVGLHEVSYVVCRRCDRIPYQLGVVFREAAPESLREAVVEHRTDGDLIERTVVRPE
jgi:hypothetical protein